MAQHAPAHSQDHRPMPPHDRLERGLVAVFEVHRQQLSVRRRAAVPREQRFAQPPQHGSGGSIAHRNWPSGRIALPDIVARRAGGAYRILENARPISARPGKGAVHHLPRASGVGHLFHLFHLFHLSHQSAHRRARANAPWRTIHASVSYYHGHAFTSHLDGNEPPPDHSPRRFTMLPVDSAPSEPPMAVERDGLDLIACPLFRPGELSNVCDSADWLWHGYLARGQITLLTGQWKIGKTALLACLLARLGTGSPLAGRDVRPGKAIVLTEEGAALWHGRCQTFGIGDHVSFAFRPFLFPPDQRSWKSLIDSLILLHRRKPLDL